MALLTNNAIFANARDPDILTDFVVPPGIDPNTITRQYFTYTGFRYATKANLTGRTSSLFFTATKKEFPALEGQGLSVAKILYPPSVINPPIYHPRSSELLIVLQGTIEVGFVDTTNKLFVQTLQPNDLFVFPKGLVHFQRNTRSDRCAVSLAVFGSSNPGAVLIGSSVFGSGIDAEILAKAFKTDPETISKIIKANE
ncbi:hypothetical protein L1049_022349 [Liquidambar formosana]|uniref:Germin-like protein n=1 Tax=Liquidambar formosana TaxID=63359 RepID=A0AAP0RDQ8_LIQFO